MYSSNQKCLSLAAIDMYCFGSVWSPWILGLSSQCSIGTVSYCLLASGVVEQKSITIPTFFLL